MKEPTRYVLAALVGWGLAAALPAQEPGRLDVEKTRELVSPPSTNQQMAETIAARLRESGQLKHYRVDISFEDGLADLTGEVADQPQHDEVLRQVQGTPGVEQVRDRISIRSTPIARTQAMNIPAPTPLPDQGGPAAGPAMGGGFNEPMPIYQAPGGGPYSLEQPKMPPYAWPTYAPYNNYSRVGYPTLYPYNAWPFIGPIHPFPKVPLGWRSIKLEWKDGWWWYSKHANGHDWWRLRYW